MKSHLSLKMGHVWLKSRSLGKFLEKPCVRCRGHIFRLMMMKLGQHICLDEITPDFEKGHVRSKTRSLGKILEKPCVRCRDHIFRLIMKLDQNVCLDEISDEFENGSCLVKKTRSLGQILEKIVYTLEATFSVR